MALVGELGVEHFIAWKSKDVWRRAYLGLLGEIQHCENEANTAFLRKFSHLLGRSEFDRFLGAGTK